MLTVAARELSTSLRRAFRAGSRPKVLILMPILLAAAWVLGGDQAMIFTGLAFPVALAIALPPAETPPEGLCSLTRLPQRSALIDKIDQRLAEAQVSGTKTGVLVLELDRYKLLEERHERAAIETVLRTMASRLVDSLRGTDLAARLDGHCFGVVLDPGIRLDLDSALLLAGRIQRSIADPISVGGVNIYATVSIGLALSSRVEDPSGETLLQAAHLAMIEAQKSGPSAIRSYSSAMRSRITLRNNLVGEVGAAIEKGHITAFFQPQVSTRTGAITGFETLARWHHPERGLIPPSEFLPALEQAGLMDKLGELMIVKALGALREWQDAGFEIPRIGVNFSNEELCDPRLVERIGFELDRHELSPDRLVIEVLETVVAFGSEDVVIRNLAGLASLGCCLDLDDFGTGHASITSIRRFSIERIKIDRSFVTRIDQDPEQQKMVGAILTMAQNLGLDTLAEGVETGTELDMLSQLGCGHVQGFGIARPMPMHETIAWIRAYNARLADPGLRQLRAV